MRTTIDPGDLLTHIYKSATDFAIFTVDLAGKVTSWNAGAEAILGYTEDQIIGTSFAVVFTPEDQARGEPSRELENAAASGKATDYRWHLRGSGERFWADGVMTPIRSDTGELIGYLKIMKDITDRKIAQDRIAWLSATDPLTGLANRASFDGRIHEMVALCTRGTQTLHLLLVDLDRFKEVNDTYGHPAGDELLRQVSRRLKEACRESDYVGRLGGDEFGILQMGANDSSMGGVLAAKIVAALARPFDIGGEQVQVSASIGIALCPDDSTEYISLLKKADLALYKAKSAGRSCYHFFTDELDRIAHKRNQDSDALRKAVAEQQFSLVYQPIVDRRTGQATAMEALVRFHNPLLAAYSVDYVIELSIELGLIYDIGKWVFREACMQLRRWQQSGIAGLTICINTCAKELLNESYLACIGDVMAETGVAPGDVEIELTERDAIDLNQAGSGVLARLVAAGFRLSLDDFGVGHSSLTYLRTLPVSTLKLDKAFLDDIPYESKANAIAKAVIALAEDLDLNVIAEGVEKEAQVQFLAAMNCAGYQGYLFSSAMPEPAATAWLLADRGPGAPDLPQVH